MKGDALSRLLVGSEGFWFHHVRVIMFDDAKNRIENSVSDVGNKLLVVYYLFFTRSTTILIFLQAYNLALHWIGWDTGIVVRGKEKFGSISIWESMRAQQVCSLLP